jgi:integrase
LRDRLLGAACCLAAPRAKAPPVRRGYHRSGFASYGRSCEAGTPGTSQRDVQSGHLAAAAPAAYCFPYSPLGLWATAFYAGLRRGELRGLRCDDVDTDARVIYVRRGWDDVEGAIDPKSRKGMRTVPMGGELRQLLLEHIARTGRRGEDLVFGRTAREPFTPTWIRRRAVRAWVGAALAAFLTGERLPVEIDLIGLHECRHTYVSLMHAAGLIEGQRAEAADAFDAFLAARTGTQTGTQAPRLAVVPHG